MISDTTIALSKRTIVIAMVLIAFVLTLIPIPEFPLIQARTLGIVLVTLSLWATALVPAYLAALIFFALTLVFKISPPETVFSGFLSPAIWLIFAGFIIGAAVKSAELNTLIGHLLNRYLTHSYRQLIFGLMLIGMALTFIVPSALGREVLMIPIGLALADRLGFTVDSNGRAAVMLSVIFGCQFSGFTVLTANVPNIVLAGTTHTLYSQDLSYTQYLLLHYPLLGLAKSLIVAILLLRLFPDQITTAIAAPRPTTDLRPLRRRRRYVAIVLILTLIAWMTDSLHGISPAWVGLIAAILLLLPRVGVVSNEQFKTNINFGLLLFIAGILALGAVVNATGLGSRVAHLLTALLPLSPEHDFISFISLSLIAFVTGMITILPGVPAVLSPLANEFAQLSGFSISAILMTQVLGFSTVLFPYQSGPLVVGMQLSGQPMINLLRVTVPVVLITIFVLWPLDYLWWKLLGVI